jgi:hypothetical protein
MISLAFTHVGIIHASEGGTLEIFYSSHTIPKEEVTAVSY